MPLPIARLPVYPAPDAPGSGPLPDSGKPAARLAIPGDAPTDSPVHRLQSELALFESAPAAVETDPALAPYPGWFRLGFPIAVSALLWVAILWGVGLIG